MHSLNIHQRQHAVISIRDQRREMLRVCGRQTVLWATHFQKFQEVVAFHLLGSQNILARRDMRFGHFSSQNLSFSICTR
jgi:hypothetical protein